MTMKRKKTRVAPRHRSEPKREITASKAPSDDLQFAYGSLHEAKEWFQVLAESSLTGIYSRMASFDYFVTTPSGPNAKAAFTRGFFDSVLPQNPKPQTVAIMGAGREFSANAEPFGLRKRKRHARETGGIGPLSPSPQLS